MKLVTFQPPKVAARASSRHGPTPRTHNGWIPDPPSAFLFLAGALYFFEFNAIGKLYLTDLALLGGLIVCLARGDTAVLAQRRNMIILLFAGLWLIGAMFTDIIVGTSALNYLRGWSRIVFLIIDFAGLAVVSRGKISRLMAYAAGLSIAQIALAVAHPTLEMVANPWKFGYGPAITMLVMIANSISLPGLFGVLSTAALFLVPPISLGLNSRSLFGTAFLAAVSSRAAQTMASSARIVLPKQRVTRFAGILALLMIAAFGGVAGYGALASRGALGTEAADKYAHDQAIGGVVLGGRSEFYGSLEAIADSPIIGHGSWARDLKYVYLRALRLREFGVETAGHYRIVDDLIPTHSYLLGSWVEAGILGASFWVMCLFLAFRALYTTVFLNSRATTFCMYVVFTFFWDIPFSFFGGWTRLFIVLQLCTCVWAANQVLTKSRSRFSKNAPTGPEQSQ